MVDNASRFIAAFTGFAVGDAFGYPCREMTFEQICKRFEKNGCLRLAVSERSNSALFTDATQLTLFTADGILWAATSAAHNADGVNYNEYVFYAYQMWLYTQIKAIAGEEYAWLFSKETNPYKSKLVRTKGLYQTRYINAVNVEVLSKTRNNDYGRIIEPINSFDDSGALKRVLPAGLFFNFDTGLAFRAGADFAAITHGAPSAYLSAGCYSGIVAELINGKSMDEAIGNVKDILVTYRGHQDVLDTLDRVRECLDDTKMPPVSAVNYIGTDDTAAHVFGLALFAAALFEDNFANAIRLAVNHDGLSDVCGALCGGLLGAYHGVSFVPKKWVKKLSYLRLIEDMAVTLVENSYFNEAEEVSEEEDEEAVTETSREITEDDFNKFDEQGVAAMNDTSEFFEQNSDFFSDTSGFDYDE